MSLPIRPYKYILIDKLAEEHIKEVEWIEALPNNNLVIHSKTGIITKLNDEEARLLISIGIDSKKAEKQVLWFKHDNFNFFINNYEKKTKNSKCKLIPYWKLTSAL